MYGVSTLIICLLFSISPAAAVMTVGEMAAGSIIEINGAQYVKLGGAGTNGPFMALSAYHPPAVLVTTYAAAGSAVGATATAVDDDNATVYYQGTNASGTSTTTPVTSAISLPAAGNYYFRARNNATGAWGVPGYVSVSYTVAHATFQTFTADDCATLPMCTSDSTVNCDTNGSTIALIDSRDGKSYKIRRFADGKCWMIDSLRYGGDTTDGCAGKSAFNGGATSTTSGSETGVSVGPGAWTNGTVTSGNSNLYGDCRDASAGAASTSPCYGNTTCGYYYSWQAVMQQASLYYASGTSGGTPLDNHGICPTGWHPPTSGSATAEFGALDKAMGGTGNNRSGDTTVLQNLSFYTTGGKFNSFYSGYCSNSGGLNYQGSSGIFWSQTGFSSLGALNLNYYSSFIYPSYGYSKYSGFAVRCVKD